MGRLYNKKDNVKFENLSDRSEKDKVWDTQRKYCDLVSELYFQSVEFERYFADELCLSLSLFSVL